MLTNNIPPKPTDFDSIKSRFDRKQAARLLKPLGMPDPANSFLDEIELFLWVDAIGCLNEISHKDQHKVLVNIFEQSTILSNLLKTICFDKQHGTNPKNLQAMALIQDALYATVPKNESDTAPTKKSLADFGVFFRPVPLDYPTDLLELLLEFTNAVGHAAEGMKLKRGNSGNRNSETIRKKKYADFFVVNYWNFFKRLPTITEDGAATQVFNLLIAAAEMPEGSYFHYLRTAINKQKTRQKITAET